MPRSACSVFILPTWTLVFGLGLIQKASSASCTCLDSFLVFVNEIFRHWMLSKGGLETCAYESYWGGESKISGLYLTVTRKYKRVGGLGIAIWGICLVSDRGSMEFIVLCILWAVLDFALNTLDLFLLFMLSIS